MPIRIPAEWEPHACCWMAWSVHREWDKTSVKRIKRNLSEVAQTIARYEPVRFLAPRRPMLREAQRERNRRADWRCLRTRSGPEGPTEGPKALAPRPACH
jgi:agmatine/peptidylarginine deiminase